MSLENKDGNDAVDRHNENMEILIVLSMAVGANDLKPNEEYLNMFAHARSHKWRMAIKT